MKKLTRAACFTDIHFGQKGNSEVHNQDCLNFIDWFCDNVTSNPDIDHIIFLGDWNQHRSALNIATLNHAYNGAKMLNSLNLPLFFILGNHDLYYKNSREIHSVVHHNEFENFTIIDKPQVFKELGTKKGSLLCPYLFHDEYPILSNYSNINIWWGHFEFRGFIVTGFNIRMMTGPNADDFKTPKRIFSGHFHKRQIQGNVVYMGNTFPQDFSDVDDLERGMMVYNYENDEIEFINWKDCPTYTKTKISDLIDDENPSINFKENTKVICVIDKPIDFEKANEMKLDLMKKYNLRDFSFEESPEIKKILSDTEATIDWDNDEVQTLDQSVYYMLDNINTEHYDKNILKEIYKDLRIQED